MVEKLVVTNAQQIHARIIEGVLKDIPSNPTSKFYEGLMDLSRILRLPFSIRRSPQTIADEVVSTSEPDRNKRVFSLGSHLLIMEAPKIEPDYVQELAEMLTAVMPKILSRRQGK